MRQDTILSTKTDQFNAGKKNHAGAAYNLLTTQYEQNNRGNNLANQDGQAHERGMQRAQNLQTKGNGSFNILTGADMQRVNPIHGAAQQIIGGQPGSGRSMRA